MLRPRLQWLAAQRPAWWHRVAAREHPVAGHCASWFQVRHSGRDFCDL